MAVEVSYLFLFHERDQETLTVPWYRRTPITAGWSCSKPVQAWKYSKSDPSVEPPKSSPLSYELLHNSRKNNGIVVPCR